MTDAIHFRIPGRRLPHVTLVALTFLGLLAVLCRILPLMDTNRTVLNHYLLQMPPVLVHIPLSATFDTHVLPAAVIACVGVLWALKLRRSGYGVWVAFLFMGVLIFHPFILFSLKQGADNVIKLIFFGVFAHGLYGLRFNPVPLNILRTSIGLAGMAFSHPAGVLVVTAALPWLPVALPPVWRSFRAWRVYALLLLPALSCVVLSGLLHWLVMDYGAAGGGYSTSPRQKDEVLFKLILSLGYVACAMPVLFVSQIANARKPGLAMVGMALIGILVSAVILDHVLLEGRQAQAVLALAVPAGFLALIQGNMVHAPRITTFAALLMAWPLSHLVDVVDTGRMQSPSPVVHQLPSVPVLHKG
jgi:hypothetical protein